MPAPPDTCLDQAARAAARCHFEEARAHAAIAQATQTRRIADALEWLIEVIQNDGGVDLSPLARSKPNHTV